MQIQCRIIEEIIQLTRWNICQAPVKLLYQYPSKSWIFSSQSIFLLLLLLQLLKIFLNFLNFYFEFNGVKCSSVFLVFFVIWGSPYFWFPNSDFISNFFITPFLKFLKFIHGICIFVEVFLYWRNFFVISM